MMADQHTRRTPSGSETDDPERIAIHEAMAFGKALYDRRTALGLSTAELAERAGLAEDDIECIEEGGTEPTIGLLRLLAAALDSDVRPAPDTISDPCPSKPTPLEHRAARVRPGGGPSPSELARHGPHRDRPPHPVPKARRYKQRNAMA
jgi:transcriptional regulator with XRE-family HTH domain